MKASELSDACLAAIAVTGDQEIMVASGVMSPVYLKTVEINPGNLIYLLTK